MCGVDSSKVCVGDGLRNQLYRYLCRYCTTILCIKSKLPYFVSVCKSPWIFVTMKEMIFIHLKISKVCVQGQYLLSHPFHV
jgi:hypothetical protein